MPPVIPNRIRRAAKLDMSQGLAVAKRAQTIAFAAVLGMALGEMIAIVALSLGKGSGIKPRSV
jgi:hypothetical protein